MAEYVRFLIIAQASNDETIDHWETLFETKSFTDQDLYSQIHERLQRLGRKLNNFIKAVENGN
jgi:four helix bundle protein